MTNYKAEQILIKIENGPDSQMIIGQEKGKILANLIKRHSPKNILEIGTNLGYSAILMAIHSPSDAKIITLEAGEAISKRAIVNISDAGFENKIEVIIGNALNTIETINKRFDFVFIDGTKKEYLDYFKLIEDNLSPHAIVVADNVKIFKEETKNYLDYVKNIFKSETISTSQDAMEITFI